MRIIKLAAKRCCTPLFCILLAVLLVLPFLCNAIGQETSVPRAGYVCESGNSKDISRMCCYLESMGFVPFSDISKMRGAIETESIDCGVIIPQDASAKIASKNYKELLTWVESSASDFSVLRRAQAATVVFAVVTPHYTADFLENSIPKSDVIDEYYSSMDSEKSFSFSIQKTSGVFDSQCERSIRYLKGGLSVLIFISLYFGAVAPAVSDANEIRKRIGLSAAIKTVFFPVITIRFCFILFSAGVGCLIAGYQGLAADIPIYTLLVLIISVFIAFLPGTGWKTSLISLLCFAALAVCPVFIDLSLFYPSISWLRWFIPPAWLWMIV